MVYPTPYKSTMAETAQPSIGRDRRCRRRSVAALLLAAIALAACTGPTQYIKRGPTAAPGAPAPGFTSAATPGQAVVGRGDTVYGIARRHGLPVRAVIAANDLAPPYALRVGQRLRLPEPRLHVVGAGDTVYNVARRYGIDRAALVRLNRIAPPYTIKRGERLVLPGGTLPRVASVSRGGVVTDGSRVAPRSSPGTRRAQPKAGKPRGPALLPRPPARAGRKFLWPARGRVISRFGPKRGGLYNDGINISAKRGARIVAAENGVVAYAGNELKGFGNLLLVKHSGGWITAYAHNEALLVGRGDTVRRGQVIARMGSTGNVARPQLHFEIRRGKRAVNPLKYLARWRKTAALITPLR